MIAYMVQLHDNFNRAARLLRWISHPTNLYIVMIDSSVKVPETFIDEVRSLPNVHIFHDTPCVWGGASLVTGTLKSISAALAISDRWESFINISGSDIPLKSQEEIVQTLQDLKCQRKTSFITDFGGCDFEPSVQADSTSHECAEIQFRPNALFYIYGQARALFSQVNTSPITVPSQRIWVNVSEDFKRKALHIRPLFEPERRARKEFFVENSFHFGRQWMILDRALCDSLCQSKIVNRCFEYLKTVLIPDECFFQTVLARPEFESPSIVRSDNLRFKLGSPHNVVNEDLNELANSKALFARKLNEERGSQVIEWVWERTGARRMTPEMTA